MKQYIPTWEETQNINTNMALYGLGVIKEDDDKFHEIVIPKLNNLWNSFGR